MTNKTNGCFYQAHLLPFSVLLLKCHLVQLLAPSNINIVPSSEVLSPSGLTVRAVKLPFLWTTGNGHMIWEMSVRDASSAGLPTLPAATLGDMASEFPFV